MKRANLPVRPEKNERKESVEQKERWRGREGGEGASPCVRKKEIKRSVKRQCVKCGCEGGASSSASCGWRPRPQGGAVTEGGLAGPAPLSPAAPLITQRAAPAVSSRKKTH